MSTTETQPSRARREAMRTGWIVVLSLLTLIPLGVWKEAREPDSPAELVEAFFQAVREKDLDEAFSYTDAAVPVGEAAAFLHPDAIGDDWEVLETTESEGEYSSETDVRVTIGHPDGIAEGRYVVSEFDDELHIENPLQQVSFAGSSQLEIQVNDHVVELHPTEQVLAAGQSRQYELLPGVYRFFGGEAVALLDPETADMPIIRPPRPEPTPEQVEAVQAAVDDRIDACVEYKTAAPPGCPFSTDGYVDTTERERLEAIEDVAWTVSEYPEVSVVPGVDLWGQPALLVGYAEPGRLELNGTGSSDYEHWKEFTAACRFGGEELVVLLRGDDEVELAPIGVQETDTCRGTE
ncbi:hypothetical protein [Glycomyces tenuis]|uniref:hypothetical protein n=1 Tax=Glycomyces tenuis TaxID=58116 RepID=UPI00040021CC|nr:hypothetical protein [Glycomyces tenuis]